jgi:hypothetical protein
MGRDQRGLPASGKSSYTAPTVGFEVTGNDLTPPGNPSATNEAASTTPADIE